jgi:hypothetical protein
MSCVCASVERKGLCTLPVSTVHIDSSEAKQKFNETMYDC